MRKKRFTIERIINHRREAKSGWRAGTVAMGIAGSARRRGARAGT